LFGSKKDKEEEKKPKFNAQKCHVCNNKFENPIEYNRHIEIFHPIEKTCVKCSGVMRVPKNKFINIVGKLSSTDIGGSAMMYLCDTCGYIEFYNRKMDWL